MTTPTMNKTISIIRIAILSVLGLFAMKFLFCEEHDEALLDFYIHMFINKALAIAIIYQFARLYKRWSKVDPWLKAYDKMCDEVLDNPNPTQP